MQRRRVWQRYFKRTDRRLSEREMSPQRLVCHCATWYLDAWCHASQGLRRFALDAVREARMLETRARARQIALRELEARLDAGCGICGSSSGDVKWATLEFDADAAQWVASEEWHPGQSSRWLGGGDGQGRCELKVLYTDPTELAMDILRHGDNVKVIGDAALAAAIAQRLHSAAARYA